MTKFTELKEKLESLYPHIAILTLSGVILSQIFKFYAPQLYIPTLIFVLLLCGLPIIIGQIINVANLNFSSDILAGISIVTALLLSEYLAACLVILMLSGGESLESYAAARASRAINAFVKRLPNSLKKLVNGKLIELELKDFNLGELFSLAPHMIAPFDGTVESGHGSVDESLLTGEAFQVPKVKGSKIISGSVNGETALVVKITAIGQDTRYEKIIKVMKEAQTKKLSIRRIGDQLGAWYTPLALVIAGIFAYTSGSSTTFLSVLVVATPCPLIIAIPVAIIGAISKAAERGILIRDPGLLENITQVKTVFLDKTGTMTYGEPSLTEVIELGDFEKTNILSLVASLEQFSSHPLSKPILKYAMTEKLTLAIPEICEEKPGVGLRGMIGQYEVIVTSRKKAIEMFAASNLPEKILGMEAIVIVNSVPALILRFQDKIKEGSGNLVNHLKKVHGINRVAILSGDTEVEVLNLAKQVGIDDVRAKLSPEDKYHIVKEESLRTPTLFVGDGINDAPALSVASIGIAFGTGSEISSEAASAVILDGKIEKLDELIHLGKRTRRIALESAVGGMALSIIGMFLAGFGYLTPVTGALAQELIDIFAVLNALRTCWSNIEPSELLKS